MTTREVVISHLNANKDHVVATVADLIIHLGARVEWSMDDNFETTETLARLASECGLPQAGDQDDAALAFYGGDQ